MVRQAMPSAWPRSSRPGLLLNDAGLDVGKGGELRRQGQTGRAAADDQDIDLLRKSARRRLTRDSARRVGDFRVAGLESVQMELHEPVPPQISQVLPDWLRLWPEETHPSSSIAAQSIALMAATTARSWNIAVKRLRGRLFTQYADHQYTCQMRTAIWESSVKNNNDKPGHLARRFQQIAVAVFHAEVEEAGYDLTPVQYAALATIGAHPGIDQVTLAGLIAYDRTTITGVVDRLVQKGLLVRQSKQQGQARPRIADHR